MGFTTAYGAQKSNTWHPCGDYHSLNGITTPDQYSIPHIQDFRASLCDAIIFSKVELVRAFNHILMNKDDVLKTAIITSFGLYEYLMMPYWLWNAAQTFQWFMDQVCQELFFIFVYMDNILVASHTPGEHVSHLQILFTCLSQYGLVINSDKCHFGVCPIYFSATALALQALSLWKIVWKQSATFVLLQARLPCKGTWDLSIFIIAFVHTVQKSSTSCMSSSKERTLLGSGYPHVRPLSSKAKRPCKHYPLGIPRSFSIYVGSCWCLEFCYWYCTGTKTSWLMDPNILLLP